jgi:hypothetical protein
MAVSHIFSNAVADWTGTVTVFNSAGATTTAAASAIVRPSDWNSAHNQFYTLTGNTTGNSTASGTNVIFAGSGGVSVGGSTGSIVISANPFVTHDGYDPFITGLLNICASEYASGSFFIRPVSVPYLEFDRVGCRVFHSNTSNSSGSWTVTQLFGVYTKNVSTLSLLSSASYTTAITGSGTQGIFSSVGGQRLLTMGLTGTLTEGDYWVGVGMRTSTAGANCTIRGIGLQQASGSSAVSYSGLFNVASNATAQPALGQGVYTATTAAIPNSIAFSQINGTLSGNSTAGFHQAFLFISGTA